MNAPAPGNAELQLGSHPGNAELQLGSHPGNAELQLGSDAVSSRAGARRSQVQGSQAWYSRGYLPHFDGAGVMQAITFRLADSLPQERLNALEQELADLPDDQRGQQRRKQIEVWLDAGMGSCALRHDPCAKIVQTALTHFHGDRYDLIAWCIMPNHVHVLIEPKTDLARIVQSWKTYTARVVRQEATRHDWRLPSHGLWMREYWDRYIRDEQHFVRAVDYIHRNPVAAGLCATPDAWPWSSAAPGNAELQLGSNQLPSRAGARRSQESP